MLLRWKMQVHIWLAPSPCAISPFLPFLKLLIPCQTMHKNNLKKGKDVKKKNICSFNWMSHLSLKHGCAFCLQEYKLHLTLILHHISTSHQVFSVFSFISFSLSSHLSSPPSAFLSCFLSACICPLYRFLSLRGAGATVGTWSALYHLPLTLRRTLWKPCTYTHTHTYSYFSTSPSLFLTLQKDT